MATDREALEARLDSATTQLDRVTSQLREAWAGLVQIAASGESGAASVASVAIAAVEKAGGKAVPAALAPEPGDADPPAGARPHGNQRRRRQT